MNFDILKSIGASIGEALMEGNKYSFYDVSPGIVEVFDAELGEGSPNRSYQEREAKIIEILKDIYNTGTSSKYVLPNEDVVLITSVEKKSFLRKLDDILTVIEKKGEAGDYKESIDALERPDSERSDIDYIQIYHLMMDKAKFPKYRTGAEARRISALRTGQELPKPGRKLGVLNITDTGHEWKTGVNKAALDIISFAFNNKNIDFKTASTFGSPLFQIPEDKSLMILYPQKGATPIARHDIEASKEVFYQYVRNDAGTKRGSQDAITLISALRQWAAQKNNSELLDATRAAAEIPRNRYTRDITDPIYEAFLKAFKKELPRWNRATWWGDVAQRYFEGRPLPRKPDQRGCWTAPARNTRTEKDISLCPSGEEVEERFVAARIGGRLTSPEKELRLDISLKGKSPSGERSISGKREAEEGITLLDLEYVPILERMNAVLGKSYDIKKTWEELTGQEFPGAVKDGLLLKLLPQLRDVVLQSVTVMKSREERVSDEFKDTEAIVKFQNILSNIKKYVELLSSLDGLYNSLIREAKQEVERKKKEEEAAKKLEREEGLYGTVDLDDFD